MTIDSTTWFLRRIISRATPHDVMPLAVMPANALCHEARSVPFGVIGYAILSKAYTYSSFSQMVEIRAAMRLPTSIASSIEPDLSTSTAVDRRIRPRVGTDVDGLESRLGLEGADALVLPRLLQLQVDQCLEVRIVERPAALQEPQRVDHLLRAHAVDQCLQRCRRHLLQHRHGDAEG